MAKFYVFLILFFSVAIKAQIINAYAKVSAINAAKTTLTVTNVNEAAHTFTVGGKVLVMQMQDDVIGANTTDAATFGNLSAISSAGLYEIGIITSRSPATGTPTTITLSTALANTFHTGANSSLQVITFRNMGTNYTTTSNITGLAWDGNIGGVIGFEVANTLTLNHSISADIIGFRKGMINTNAVAGTCLPNLYITNSVSQAYKGEGIYKSTNANYANARGKILNGGGGGNEHNGGGGGGGNYTAGGAGGFGYSCGTGSNSGGLGGISLSGQISSNRIFMGGGGGGGQQNNTVGLDGGPGGGIILIKATTIVTNAVCSNPIKITANGGSTASCGNDGAGGGGAAGTIVLQVTNYSASTTCPLTINANGGTGGNVGDGAEHGGGGGGGQGAIIFSINQPTVNITSTTTNGTGGQNNSGQNSFAGNGGGTNNSGILSFGGPLPVELLEFNGEPHNDNVRLFWTTATEINNDYYTVEKSSDGVHFNALGTVKAVGDTKTKSSYEFYDTEPLSLNYYRLKQTDRNGTFSYSRIVSVAFDTEVTFSLYPNPAGSNDPVFVSINKSLAEPVELCIYDVTGKLILSRSIHAKEETRNEVRLDGLELASGIYMIRLFNSKNNQTKKLVVR